MKLLILQLASLDDLLLSFPAIRATVRENPGWEIHLLVRSTFRNIAVELPISVKVRYFDTERFIRPLLGDARQDALTAVEELIHSLQNENYDRMVNLSYSMMSSYLASAVARGVKDLMVSGLTRFVDGTLSIPDDASAYIFAQVGEDRENHFHMTELFASVLGVHLRQDDWSVSRKTVNRFCIDSQDIIVDLGDGLDLGGLSQDKWNGIIQKFVKKSGSRIVLVGVSSKMPMASYLSIGVAPKRLLNLVGKVTYEDLFEIFSFGSMVLTETGTASHIASLVDVKTVRIAIGKKNIFGVTPRAPKSLTYIFSQESELFVGDFVRDVLKLFGGGTTTQAAVCVDEMREIKEIQGTPSTYSQIVRTLYLGDDFPTIGDDTLARALLQLNELLVIALNQLVGLERVMKDETLAHILDTVDESVVAIGRIVKDLQPLIRWYEVECLRIGPHPLEKLVQLQADIYMRFQSIVQAMIIKTNYFQREVEYVKDGVDIR